MSQSSLYYRISTLLIIIFMSSSCALTSHHSNSSDATAQRPEQIQEANPSQSRYPDAQSERIHIEDESVQIDELRVRGQTQAIEVKPQNNMPAYEIVPATPARPDDKAAGQSRWRILSF